MSKLKKKHIVKLMPGESAVVMTYDTLMYLAQTCDILAEQQDNTTDAGAWRDVADTIRVQAEENYHEVTEEDWA